MSTAPKPITTILSVIHTPRAGPPLNERHRGRRRCSRRTQGARDETDREPPVVAASERPHHMVEARDLADPGDSRHGQDERRDPGEDRLPPVDAEDLVVALGHLYASNRAATTLQLQYPQRPDAPRGPVPTDGRQGPQGSQRAVPAGQRRLRRGRRRAPQPRARPASAMPAATSARPECAHHGGTPAARPRPRPCRTPRGRSKARRHVAERQQVAQVPVLERAGEERPGGARASSSAGSRRSRRRPRARRGRRAPRTGPGLPCSRSASEVEDGRPLLGEEAFEALGISFVGEALVAVHRVCRVGACLLEQRGERLVARLRPELLDVDARRHDLDASRGPQTSSSTLRMCSEPA